MKEIYLDNNATSKIHPDVAEAILECQREYYGNPSSIHDFGLKAQAAVNQAKEKIADFLGCSPKEIIFTSGGTESNNLAIKGLALANREKGNHIITSQIEHHSVLTTCKYLESQGIEVTYMSVDHYGLIDCKELEEAINNKTILISIMHANNEVGTIQSIDEISNIARDKGVFFHTDAVQSFTKIPINVNESKIDLLSLSAHKGNGPKGIGLLCVREGIKLTPLFHGGEQEEGRRAGTENVPNIVGLGRLVELLKQDTDRRNQLLTRLRDRLFQGIKDKGINVKLNGHPTRRLPNTLNISFDDIEGRTLIISLNLEGIAASQGSACTIGTLKASHVLTAMGKTPEEIQGSIRFSLGYENTEEEIDYVVNMMPKVIEYAREYGSICYLKGEFKYEAEESCCSQPLFKA
ncbi:MAG: cysteine desulfurase [Candidatus Scalindua rubra]|uniref:cysteine desulfurase n=1 Tax=Candidatus Scalindua rubra TaxID=1872076 RepID=A0A1E3X758_9BACT|nr:MAG: cysteine desulfurase [Candidatus Scalindua rubra]